MLHVFGATDIDACSLFPPTCKLYSTNDHSSQDFLQNHHYWKYRRTKYHHLHTRSHCHHSYVHNFCLFRILLLSFLFRILFFFNYFLSFSFFLYIPSNIIIIISFFWSSVIIFKNFLPNISDTCSPVLSLFITVNWIFFILFLGYLLLSFSIPFSGVIVMILVLPSWRSRRVISFRGAFEKGFSISGGNISIIGQCGDPLVQWLNFIIPCSFWISDPEINKIQFLVVEQRHHLWLGYRLKMPK